MPKTPFDLSHLFVEIDRERRRQGLSWTALARHVGVSSSTIRRLESADDAEADGVLALIDWLDMRPEDFVPGSAVRGRKLIRVEDGYIRVDMARVTAAQRESSPSRGRTRTTIQRLVQAAQGSHQPIAELTRTTDS